MKVFIGTPTYDKKVVCEYMQSMLKTVLQLNQDGIEAHIGLIGGDCFVDHARNQIVDAFLQTDCTDLVMIDADQGWEVDNLRHLLVRPEPIVAGVVIGREDEGKWHITPDVDEEGNAYMHEGMLSVSKIGAAFIRIKREAIEKMVEAYPDDFYVKNGKKVPALFKTTVEDNEFIGEDVSFCRKWLSLGEKIYVMPDMTFQHVGIKKWSGNFFDYLMTFPSNKIEADSSPTITEGQPNTPVDLPVPSIADSSVSHA